jgi:hypothetical protein
MKPTIYIPSPIAKLLLPCVHLACVTSRAA